MTPSCMATKNDTQKTRWAVSFRVLLGLYAIVPLCLCLQLLDEFFLQGWLLDNLPNSPGHFLLFQLLFGTPHILASSVLLLSNSDYLRFYQPKLITMSLLIMVVFGLGSLYIPYNVLYVIAASWTVYHVLKQQIGVGRSVYQLSNRAFYLLLWFSVGAGIFIYLGIFLHNSLDNQQTAWIKYLASSFSVLLILTAAFCHFKIRNPLGKVFLWANTSLVVISLYLYLQDYYFLAILMPRLVHDATAYIFYITHDYNKHQIQPQNWLYRCSHRCKLPVFVVLPVLSVALTFILQIYGNQIVSFFTEILFGIETTRAISVGLIGYLSLMHYYTEAFIWKKGSPLRQFIFFKS